MFVVTMKTTRPSLYSNLLESFDTRHFVIVKCGHYFDVKFEPLQVLIFYFETVTTILYGLNFVDTVRFSVEYGL